MRLGAAARRVAREADVVVEQQHVLVPGQHEPGAAHELFGVRGRDRSPPPQLCVAWERIGEHDRVGEIRHCVGHQPLHLGLIRLTPKEYTLF